MTDAPDVRDWGSEFRLGSPAEWNFEGVPDAELVACCFWEYARESAFIRDVKRRCIDSQWKKMTNSQLWKHCGFDIERIQSIGCPSEVFLAGFFFDEAEDRKPRHRDAPPITGSFPAPWQTLSVAERKYRSRIRTDRETIPLAPFQRGYSFFAADIVHWCKAQQGEAQKTGHDIHPSLFLGGSEVGVFRIQWENYTNDELTLGFREWVKANRPERFPNPSRKGRKPGDWRAQLTRLAVMRLLSRYKASDILQDERGPILRTKPFIGRKWLDTTKWHDARREAGKLFRRLFPFLPLDEKPRSWCRKAPGK